MLLEKRKNLKKGQETVFLEDIGKPTLKYLLVRYLITHLQKLWRCCLGSMEGLLRLDMRMDHSIYIYGMKFPAKKKRACEQHELTSLMDVAKG